MQQANSPHPLPVEGYGLECLDDVHITGKFAWGSLTFHLSSQRLDTSWQQQSSSLVLSELQASLGAEGTYALLNCSCGESGCADRGGGVSVWHREQDVIWHDTDRGVWLKLPRERLSKELKFLMENVVQTARDPSRDGHDTLSMRIEPWQNSVFLRSRKEPSQEEPPRPQPRQATVEAAEPETTGPRASHPARRLLGESADSKLRSEIWQIVAWADEDLPLFPLGTSYEDLLKILLDILPEIGTKLPLRDRLLLIVAGAMPHVNGLQYEPLAGFERLAEHLDSVGYTFEPFGRIRLLEPFRLDDFPPGPGLQFRLVALLLRLCELLNASRLQAWNPIPGAETVFDEPETEQGPLSLGERVMLEMFSPLGLAGRQEFWKRAYLTDVSREADRSIVVRFDLPRGRVDVYERWLVATKFKELSALWETARPMLAHNGITTGALTTMVVSSRQQPPMPTLLEDNRFWDLCS